MADKAKAVEPEVKATAELAPVAPTGISDARAAALANLWNCTPEEARERENARLAAKKPKAAAP